MKTKKWVLGLTFIISACSISALEASEVIKSSVFELKVNGRDCSAANDVVSKINQRGGKANVKSCKIGVMTSLLGFESEIVSQIEIEHFDMCGNGGLIPLTDNLGISLPKVDCVTDEKIKQMLSSIIKIGHDGKKYVSPLSIEHERIYAGDHSQYCNGIKIPLYTNNYQECRVAAIIARDTSKKLAEIKYATSARRYDNFDAVGPIKFSDAYGICLIERGYYHQGYQDMSDNIGFVSKILIDKVSEYLGKNKIKITNTSSTLMNNLDKTAQCKLTEEELQQFARQNIPSEAINRIVQTRHEGYGVLHSIKSDETRAQVKISTVSSDDLVSHYAISREVPVQYYPLNVKGISSVELIIKIVAYSELIGTNKDVVSCSLGFNYALRDVGTEGFVYISGSYDNGLEVAYRRNSGPAQWSFAHSMGNLGDNIKSELKQRF